MPWPTIVGNRVPLSLGAKWTGSAARLPLNLGVDSSTPPDTDPPPDPTVVVGGLLAAIAAAWHPAAARSSSVTAAAWGALQPIARQSRAEWGGLQDHTARIAAVWSTPASLQAAAAATWGAGQASGIGVAVQWSRPQTPAAAAAMGWGLLQATVSRAAASPWRMPPAAFGGAVPRWRAGSPRGVAIGARWRSPGQLQADWRIPWGLGRGLDWVVRPPPPVIDPPTAHAVDARRIGLNLACPVFSSDTRRLPLNLGITACYLGRTQRRAYIVLNDIEVVRLPDRLPIHVDGVSLAAGREGWCWDAQLSLADPSQLPALSPTVDGPRTVEITLNGYRWVIAVEAHDKGEVWGSTEVSLRGRSLTAQLAEPYAAPRTTEVTSQRTMVQLADAEVAGSALSVDYGTVDWLVSAGAWYYDGLTPMAALARLAEASGGTVQSHPSEPVVQIRARFPVSPWDWPTTTPDVVIQDDIVTGARLQLQSKPLYDAVIVAGERVGVAAKVKRTGEAGQTYAPQQVDQLITHADGARERGRNVLSDRGGQASIEHDLPLFGAPLQPGQPGLVLPLQLVQRVASEGTWHGLATAVRIEARRQDKAVEIVQTVTIERHYTDAD